MTIRLAGNAPTITLVSHGEGTVTPPKPQAEPIPEPPRKDAEE